MWAVLAHSEDAAAWWVFTRFRDRQLAVQGLSIEELAAPDTTWTHEVGALGASVQACLGSGRLISPGVDAVLNRMVTPPGAALAAAVEQDKPYAQGEITAFA